MTTLGMTIAIFAIWSLGLVTGWALTGASAAAELRRKHAEWKAITGKLQSECAALALELAGKPVARDPMCPVGTFYVVHGKGGKTGGDAA